MLTWSGSGNRGIGSRKGGRPGNRGVGSREKGTWEQGCREQRKGDLGTGM